MAAVGLMAISAFGGGSAQAAPTAPKLTPVKLTPVKLKPDAKLSPRLMQAKNKRISAFVQFSGQGAADVAATARNLGRSAKSVTDDAKSRRSQVRTTANVVSEQAKKADSQARLLFTTSNSIPGVGLNTTVSALSALAGRPDVVKITPIVSKTIDNAASGALVKALATWQQTGITGKGVKIGVIDTGIDYTHADFGGPGTKEAYDAAHATADSGAPWTPTTKVAGGWDFVGDDYNADPSDPKTYEPEPHPDPNPLDCEGHGTHVAGTAAGYGVTADGKTFTGNYRSLTSSTLRSMSIGPGMAPQASLYALRVFGCEGSTDMVIPALDWALDPNGDGNFSDHLDIVNLSLGADFGAADDPENAVVDNLAKHGVLPVFASGNAGDITDVGGSSGNAPRALTVANSVDGYNLLDQVDVLAPQNVAGKEPGQFSVDYPWASKEPVSGPVVQLKDDPDGCNSTGEDPPVYKLSADDAKLVDGKVAWLEWDDNDATRRCGSKARSDAVAAAGGIGVILTSTLDEFPAGITGSTTIPVFQLTGTATTKLRPAATAGDLKVKFDGSLALTYPVTNKSAVDTLNDSSSRNTHGAPGVVKPDVAAPGTTIISAAVGTGNGRANLSGTSMATPHIAGIAALVKKQHPTWTVEQIKAAVMNTATADIYSGPNKSGDRYGPNRVGAGRTDARYAVSTVVLAYSKSKPGVVSASFGVVEAPITAKQVTKTQQVTVQNKANSPRTVQLSYSPVVKQPGVSYSVSPKSLRLKARSQATVKVTMTVKPRSLRRTIDPTMATTTVDGLVGEGPRQFVADASGHLLVKPTGKTALRVPVYGAAKPVSATSLVTTRSGGSKVFKVAGTGVDQGSGDTAFSSAASVMALGATSRKLPTCSRRQLSDCVLNATAAGVDLQYTGLGSLGTAETDGYGWFGFSTWGNWSTLAVGGQEVDFAIDTNDDDDPDYYVVYLPGQSDQPMSVIFDATDKKAGPVPVAAYPVNATPASTDTNAYDTNVAMLPFLLSDVGVPDGAMSYPIRYQAVTFSGFYGDPNNGLSVDSTGWVSADLLHPALQTDGLIIPDQKGVALPYSTSVAVAATTTTAGTDGSGGDRTANVGSTTPASKPVKTLVLHLYGKSGQRAQVLTAP